LTASVAFPILNKKDIVRTWRTESERKLFSGSKIH